MTARVMMLKQVNDVIRNKGSITFNDDDEMTVNDAAGPETPTSAKGRKTAGMGSYGQ